MSEPMMLETETWNHLNVNEGWLLQCCIKLMCTEWDWINFILGVQWCSGTGITHNKVTLLRTYFPIFGFNKVLFLYFTHLRDWLSCHCKSLMSPISTTCMFFKNNISQAVLCILDGWVLGIKVMCESVVEVCSWCHSRSDATCCKYDVKLLEGSLKMISF